MSDGRPALVLRLHQTVSIHIRKSASRTNRPSAVSILGGGQGRDEGDTRDEENPRKIAEEKTMQDVKGEDSVLSGEAH